MSRTAQIIAILSLAISFAFAAITLLLHPLWEDVNNFLGTSLPVMLSASIFGGICFAGSLYLLEIKGFGLRWHYALFLIADVVMIGLLAYLLSELGPERAVLTQQFTIYLPYVVWLGLIILYLWFMPRLSILQSRPSIVSFIAALAVSALIWRSLPLQFELTSQPVIFLQDGGAVVTWGTNMTATGEVEYSLDGEPTQTITNQTHGLRNLGDGIVRIFVPFQLAPLSMNLTAISEGIRALRPTSVNKTDKVASENISIQFPDSGDEISFVSFSDLHEQADIYEALASHIVWDEMDMAVYNGDLLNSTADAQQVTRSILGLATGSHDLPRIFVRGNHETRNKSARLLDNWLLPEGGHWYQAFTFGNTFFIALDGGEDKPDADKEYGGLVDFTSYHQEQAEWLKKVLSSQEYQAAQYRVVLLHTPLFGEDQAPLSFEPVAALLRKNSDIDLMINGHTHLYGIFAPDETGLPYPAAFSGGPETDTAAAVVVRMGNDMLQVQVIDINGIIVDQIP